MRREGTLEGKRNGEAEQPPPPPPPPPQPHPPPSRRLLASTLPLLRKTGRVPRRPEDGDTTLEIDDSSGLPIFPNAIVVVRSLARSGRAARKHQLYDILYAILQRVAMLLQG